MIVALAILATLAAILCTLAYLAEDPANGYHARHRKDERLPWLWKLRLQLDRTWKAIYLRLLVVPAEPVVEEPWIRELTVTPADDIFDHPGFGGSGCYAHLRPDELDAKADRAKALAEKGIRPVSPWVIPGDVWESELVGAA